MTNTTAAPVLLETPLSRVILGHSVGAGVWRQLARANGMAVCSAECLTEIVSFGNPTTMVAHRIWNPDSDINGPADETIITDDGCDVLSVWCNCLSQDFDVAVYYERWSQHGREAHGWACPVCRGIVQVG